MGCPLFLRCIWCAYDRAHVLFYSTVFVKTACLHYLLRAAGIHALSFSNAHVGARSVSYLFKRRIAFYSLCLFYREEIQVVAVVCYNIRFRNVSKRTGFNSIAGFITISLAHLAKAMETSFSLAHYCSRCYYV